MERSERFVVEGRMQIGPTERFFTFVDGEILRELLVNHFRLPREPIYTDVGRVRVTVEMLEE